jgi:phospholipid transport system substrate-binding protein
MLRKTALFSIQLIVMLCITPLMAIADDKTPQEIIEETSSAVLAALSSDAEIIQANPNKINELVDEIILPICDLERMGKYILAKHWKSATEDQRKAFISEFKQILIRNYGTHLAEYSDAKITVLSNKVSEEKLYQTVSTKLDTSIGSKPFQVDYVFRVTEESSKVVDVRVDGMSILKTFRTAFSQEIAETSLSALIDRITLVNQPAIAMNTTQ